MSTAFPFYSKVPEKDGPGIYHTHPRCRIAQSIAETARVLGTGDGRRECPFCFLLGQFEANRGLRGRPAPSVPRTPPSRETGTTASPSPERSYRV